MNIRSIWGRMPRGQRRAGGTLAGFLAAMLAFTAISRALDAFTIARVTVSAPSHGALSHEVSLQGTTEVMSEISISLPAGFPVRELYLREGERIEQGDMVALLDTDAIEKELERAGSALEDARLAAAADALHAETPVRDSALEQAQLRLERAYQDVDIAQQNGRNAIARAESELRYAQRERYRLLDEGDFTDAEMDAVRKEISTLGFAVEDAVRTAEQAVTDAEREVEDAALALELAEREEEQNAQEVAESEELNRQARSLQSGRNALTIGEKLAAVQELQALVEAQGRITAPQGGVVTGVRIQAGDVTSSGGAFLLSGQDGCLFLAQATKQEAARLAVGDRVEVLLSGYSAAVDALVTSIRAPEQPGDGYTVAVELPVTDAPPTWPGTLRVVKRAGDETTLVPLASLYTLDDSPDRGYVFVLRERSTTMGMQMAVERLDVQILDRGRRMAAVQAAFAPDDRIVTASSRYLADGDRVRLETGA